MSNDWQKHYAAKRRMIDRAILAECERALAEAQGGPSAAFYEAPIDFDNEDAKRIAKAFGRPLDGSRH
jgi:hypothetical protein